MPRPVKLNAKPKKGSMTSSSGTKKRSTSKQAKNTKVPMRPDRDST